MTKKKKTEWNPRMEFDVISVGDGSVLWKDYGDPRRYVVTRGNESPHALTDVLDAQRQWAAAMLQHASES